MKDKFSQELYSIRLAYNIGVFQKSMHEISLRFYMHELLAVRLEFIGKWHFATLKSVSEIKEDLRHE